MPKKIIKEIFKQTGVDVRRHDPSQDIYKGLHKKYRDFTMISNEAFSANLELCNKFKSIAGDFVECGVWRGGMSAAVSEIISPDRTLHLFDSFEGLPPAKEIDGKEALHWQQNTEAPEYYDNCAAGEEFAIQAMSLAKCKSYKIHKGWFDKTIPDFNVDAIGILRLDGDWYDSILVCLKHLFPRVSSGGVVILDDYYAWDGCTKAVHDYLSTSKNPSRIYQWNNQVAYIVKKDG